MEDNGADNDLNCWVLAQELLEERNFSMLPRDCLCDILVREEAAFCLLPFALVQKVSLRLKRKVFGLILLAEEIPKQPSIDSAIW